MKIIVFSDNHGNIDIIKKIMNHHPEINTYLHCGDYCHHVEIPELIRVVGNCDTTFGDEIKIIQLCNRRILLTHGHLFPRFNIEKALIAYAKKMKCDIVCFGHIHVKVNKLVDDILLVNPSSLSYNYDNSEPAYVILDLITKSVVFHSIGGLK